jgi:hypothetical protein
MKNFFSCLRGSSDNNGGRPQNDLTGIPENHQIFNFQKPIEIERKIFEKEGHDNGPAPLTSASAQLGFVDQNKESSQDLTLEENILKIVTKPSDYIEIQNSTTLSRNQNSQIKKSN